MRTDNPNYGPGSISTKAKAKVALLKAEDAKAKKPSLLNAIMNPTPGAKSQSSAAIEDRINQQKALKKEVGGSR